jgi:hypothetical protein
MLSGGKAIGDGTLDEVKQSEQPEIQAFFRRIAAGEMRGSASALDTLRGASP